MTSHDVVDFIRRKFNIKKVGHAGTLDPLANGVLVMLLGSFTRASNKFMNDDKEYDVVMRLGVRTETQDAEGKIISEQGLNGLSQADVKNAFKHFVGVQKQLPPMYSAVRHKGKKLYELAREGKTVKREPRAIEIHKIEISSINFPFVEFQVHCSKGTYVRQLSSDIGDELGCGAYAHSIRRVRSGRFSVNDAVSLKELEGAGIGLAERLHSIV